MFIRFDDLDLKDFFESEPISIGEDGEATFIYSIMDSHLFSMTLVVETYTKRIDISVMQNNNTIFEGQFENVSTIRKNEDVLLVEMEDEKRLVIKKSQCLGVYFENM